MEMTCENICALYKAQLNSFFTKREINELIALAFFSSNNWNKVDVSLNKYYTLNENEVRFHKQVIGRLKADEPIQYILGQTMFYDLVLNVKPGVLIPRPETEELVDWILESVDDGTSCLDIGTGSGCIALALKSKTKNVNVTAIDSSKEALLIAKENAKNLNLDVNFIEEDIFNPRQIKKKWDFIISNPPYIPEYDKNMMDNNVLNYEPHNALFVKDDTPLIFYKQIAKFSLKQLNKGGAVFFEIHHSMGLKIVELLASLGFVDVELKKDLQQKDRMVKAKLGLF
ncbi:MAG: protein-(glutamine-N5) methyltransferase, release factor-specific [Crocinitomicaceae bacterium]|nr:protein-(glutamine-N5) methyltransferase, release factor-specific [Crocinitomicaceae bacterium]